QICGIVKGLDFLRVGYRCRRNPRHRDQNRETQTQNAPLTLYQVNASHERWPSALWISKSRWGAARRREVAHEVCFRDVIDLFGMDSQPPGTQSRTSNHRSDRPAFVPSISWAHGSRSPTRGSPGLGLRLL